MTAVALIGLISTVAQVLPDMRVRREVSDRAHIIDCGGAS